MDSNQRKGNAKKLRERAAARWARRPRPAGDDAGWLLRAKLVWPLEDGFDKLGPRGRIVAFGGTAMATGAVVAVLALGLSGGGSGSDAGTTEALVIRQAPTPAPAPGAAPAAKPKKTAAKPSGPTLHGAAPVFQPAKGVKAGIGAGKAVAKSQAKPATPAAGEAPAARGAASTAKIGATPTATASAEAQADSLEGKTAGVGIAEKGATGEAPLGPVAPKAAKQTARRFAEAFVIYEVGGVDSKVRSDFGRTTTKQLSHALLRRPPRQPAGVAVPQAKVVNVVAGPSREGVYPVSVSLLRVGATSELRLELEQGVGKKWQVTNVLG
jgi:hypothetical protein